MLTSQLQTLPNLLRLLRLRLSKRSSLALELFSEEGATSGAGMAPKIAERGRTRSYAGTRLGNKCTPRREGVIPAGLLQWCESRRRALLMRLALDRFSDSQTFPLMPTRVTVVDELYGSKLRLGDALGAANVDFAGG